MTETPKNHPFNNPPKDIPPSILCLLGLCAGTLMITAMSIRQKKSLKPEYKEALLLALNTTIYNIHTICEEEGVDGEHN